MDYDTLKHAADAEKDKAVRELRNGLLKAFGICTAVFCLLTLVIDVILGRSWTWRTVLREGMDMAAGLIVLGVINEVLGVYVEWKDFYSAWKARN